MYFNYLKRHIINAKNFILLIIFFLISIALMFTVSICTTFLSLKENLYDNNTKFRTLLVDGDEEKYSKLKDIEHVVAVEDKIYGNSLETEVSEFNSDLNGTISLNPILDESNLIITNGRNIKNMEEAICSDVFYPYEMETSGDKTIFNKNRLMRPKDIIGRTFKVTSEEDENIVLNFKIVGTYDFKKNNNSLNSCYISKDAYIKLKSKYDGGTSTYDEETGEMVFIPSEYTGKVVVVDKYKNVEKVSESITKIGLYPTVASELNQGYIALLTYVPILGSIIILCVFCIILESYLAKKIKYNCKSYAILKSVGYDNKTIKSLDIIENIILLTISFVVSLIVYIITFNYIKNVAFAEYIYDGTILSFSITPIIISLILMITLLIVANRKVLNHKLEKNISEILL